MSQRAARPRVQDDSRWTPSEDAIIRAGRVAGLSFTAISRKLKARTPNAVIGRANRLGLPPKGTRAKVEPLPVSDAGPAKTVAVVNGNRKIIAPVPVEASAGESTTLGRLDAMWKRLAGPGCQHFTGGRPSSFVRCGKRTVELRPYCAEHDALCSAGLPVPAPRKTKAA